MKPSDISEIKHLYQLDPERCGIHRISGCYVNGEKTRVVEFTENFLTLPEEERFKYLEIFRKTLSGTRDRNLLLLRPRQVHREDHSGDMTGEEVKLLQTLIETDLKDEAVLKEFYDRVIEHFQYIDNYLILLARQNYDVPGKTLDGLELEDASEEVYRHVLCAICPVKPTKPGLGYDPTDKAFHNLTPGQIVELPMNGFLYPAFVERSADPDMVLYYSKDTVDIRPGFADAVLGSGTPLAANGQKESFTELLTETLGEEGDLSTVLQIQDSLREIVKEKKEEQESPVLNKEDVRVILSDCGVAEERLKDFDERFDAVFTVQEQPETEKDETALSRYPEDVPIEDRIFVASNLVPGRKLEVKNADFTIRINTDRTELLETRVIDGKKCLVIELEDGVSVNGIPIGI